MGNTLSKWFTITLHFKINLQIWRYFPYLSSGSFDWDMYHRNFENFHPNFLDPVLDYKFERNIEKHVWSRNLILGIIFATHFYCDEASSTAGLYQASDRFAWARRRGRYWLAGSHRCDSWSVVPLSIAQENRLDAWWSPVVLDATSQLKCVGNITSSMIFKALHSFDGSTGWLI